jgi:transketolase
MALAERMLNAQFGDIVDHHTYVVASDGDLMEGISQEAIAIAGHLRLNRLIVFHDENHVTIDGPLSLADSVDQVKRFQACNWNALRIDGHDQAAILRAIRKAQKSEKPSLIACKTTIGFGIPTRAGTSKAHSDAPGAEEIAGTRRNLNWAYEPFVIPEPILAAWRKAGKRGGARRKAWLAALQRLPESAREEFERRLRGDLPATFGEAVLSFKRKLAEDHVKKIIGGAPIRIAVEAAVRQGWDAIIGDDGIFIGMTGFGASAPYKDLYKHFKITPEAVAEAAVRRCNG